MTTTAAGDAAVARLNNATRAFEKIITGASNQVVDVPGYGNQPTLAARVDQRLDETTTTAAAEANRSRDEADRATTQANAAANSVTLATAEFNKAKTQADRAQSEADRAAQITGLDTVSDAVAMAALPLPDVWAPLSDSLRMITGYGREVKVGEDVVARMVNFSRNSTATYIGKDGQLKTAAVNEPRFEKEGLLVEGPSTNLVPNSKNPPPTSSETRVTLVASPYGDVFKFAAATANESMKEVKFAPLTAGQLVTLSFIAKKAEIDTVAVGLDGMFSALFNLTSVSVGGVQPGSSATIRPIGDGFYRATLTTTTTRDVTPSLRLKVNGTFVANAVGDGMLIGNIQAELLPFASSYIPTNGAAVTRAADVAAIPQARNIPDLLGSSYAIAAKFTLKPGVSKPYRFLFRTGNILTESMGIFQLNGGTKLKAYQGSADPGNNFVLLPLVEGSSFVCGLGIRSGKVVAYSSVDRAVVANPSTFTPNSTQADFLLGDLRLMANYQPNNEAWGHIRDLRIWWQELSDAQWKVVS